MDDVRITTLTVNPVVDLSVTVDRVEANRKLRCRDPEREPGGGGINVARVVCRLGARARAVFAAGGSAGELLTRLLEAEGVPAEPVAVDGFTRENLMVAESGSDRQYRFLLPGAELTADEQDRLIEAALADDPDYVVTSGSLPPGVPANFYARLARAAPPGTRVVLDTSGEALSAGVESGVFLVKPNLRELGHLAGREVSEDPAPEEAARSLIEGGRAEYVVVSLGAGGALLATTEGTERIAAPTVPIRSRVGAGDSTVAGMVVGLVQGDDIATAVRLGVAAGAAAVMSPGTGLCRREDVERLFRRLRERAGET
ncbi:MAG: 1-phosphofructokinase family hexose kinase [Gemmatimonadota bacterium]